MINEHKEMQWFRISLTPEQKEFGFKDIIRAEMEEILISLGAPSGMTVWVEEDGELLNIYFSPLAAAAAKILIFRFDGASCKKPEYGRITFLLGHIPDNDIS